MPPTQKPPYIQKCTSRTGTCSILFALMVLPCLAPPGLRKHSIFKYKNDHPLVTELELANENGGVHKRK